MLAYFLSYKVEIKDNLKDLRTYEYVGPTYAYVGPLEDDILKSGIWTVKCIHLAPDSNH